MPSRFTFDNDAKREAYREVIRELCGNDNVVTDLDLVFRTWTPHDPVGTVALIEYKSHGAGLSAGQARTFELMDSMMDNDPRYRGFYKVHDNSDGTYDVRRLYADDPHGTLMTYDQYATWLESGATDVWS